MKKVLFLALHLGFGGAEKAIVSEANLLSEKYDVEIACAYKLYEKPAFALDERVKVRYLSEKLKPNKDELKKALQNKNVFAILREGLLSFKVLYHRKASIKKAIKNSDADIIISTRYIFHKILAKHKKKGVITIAQEHNHHNNDEVYIKKMIAAVNGIDYFMPVSQELTEFYAKRLDGVRCVYIPHSLDFMPEQVSLLEEPILISVGRLAAEKGYLDLIKVFSKLSAKHPKWKLHIVGDGEERTAIENEIMNLGLEDRVVLHGYQNKQYINQLLEKASIYVMASYTESFGIVLIEAQSFGIPCIAFDSARGALEIIEDQKNGYLIPNRDKDMMCDKIISLIENPSMRKEFGKNGRENSLEYAVENIKAQWFKFIDNM